MYYFSFIRSIAAEYYNTVQFSSVQSLSDVRLCNPMNRSTPGLPVHHELPELTQTHVHQVDDAIQPSHPLSSPSLPAPNPSQHQGLIQLFVRPPKTTILPFCISFPQGWSSSLSPVQCHEPPSIVHQALCLSDLVP